MIMVDELRSYTQAAKPGGERYFGNGKSSCHLTTDGDIEELHTFAERLGLQRRWCQRPHDPLWAHYDLTPNKRRLAVQLGAVEVPGMEQARHRASVILARKEHDADSPRV